MRMPLTVGTATSVVCFRHNLFKNQLQRNWGSTRKDTWFVLPKRILLVFPLVVFCISSELCASCGTSQTDVMSVVSAWSHFWGDFLFLFIYFILDIWIKSSFFLKNKNMENKRSMPIPILLIKTIISISFTHFNGNTTKICTPTKLTHPHTNERGEKKKEKNEGRSVQTVAVESESARRGGRHDLAVYPQCLPQHFDAMARSQAEKFPKTCSACRWVFRESAEPGPWGCVSPWPSVRHCVGHLKLLAVSTVRVRTCPTPLMPLC